MVCVINNLSMLLFLNNCVIAASSIYYKIVRKYIIKLNFIHLDTSKLNDSTVVNLIAYSSYT